MLVLTHKYPLDNYKVFAISRIYFRLLYPRVSPSTSGRQRINMNKHDSMAIHIIVPTIINKNIFNISLVLYVRQNGIEFVCYLQYTVVFYSEEGFIFH